MSDDQPKDGSRSVSRLLEAPGSALGGARVVDLTAPAAKVRKPKRKAHGRARSRGASTD